MCYGKREMKCQNRHLSRQQPILQEKQEMQLEKKRLTGRRTTMQACFLSARSARIAYDTSFERNAGNFVSEKNFHYVVAAERPVRP